MTHKFNKQDMMDMLDEPAPDEGESALVYTVVEAAKALACSDTTIRDMVNRGDLRAVQVGKWGIRIPKRAVLELLNEPAPRTIRRRDLVDTITDLRLLASKLEELIEGSGGPRQGRT